MNVLLIEDDQKLAEFIKHELYNNGYTITTSSVLSNSLENALKEEYDLIILDIMLPTINSLFLCKELRSEKLPVPFLILCSLETIENEIKGFDRCIDDFLVKPFHFQELQFRLDALTRKNHALVSSKSTLSFCDIFLDRERKIANRNNKEIILTLKEYILLELFLQNANKVLARDFIAERVWKNRFFVSANLIEVYINYLRNKIDKGFEKKMIHTVVGVGYSLRLP